ncbi:MAG: hypothetical protein IJ808_06375 [Muribaculaceae bacterium]|nr:hypothetical protein [Muribaculaceae bacterium]
MERAIVITPRVLKRLKNMSIDEKKTIFDTLMSDEILHCARACELTPIQELTYMMVRDAIMRDSYRYESQQTQDLVMVS